MNKTRTLLALLCCLLLMVGAACAESPFAGVEKDLPLPSPGVKGMVRPAGDMEKVGLSLPENADKVTIDENGLFSIQTSMVTCGVSLPFGWIGFTQDLMAQLDLYLALTNDPMKLLNQLVEDNISLLSYDSDMESTIMLRVYMDGMSLLLGDMSAQDEKTMAAVLDYYKNQVSNATDASVERVGSYTFVRLTLSQGDSQVVMYETVYNNTNICLTLDRENPEDDSVFEDFVTVLEELTLAVTPAITNERG